MEVNTVMYEVEGHNSRIRIHHNIKYKNKRIAVVGRREAEVSTNNLFESLDDAIAECKKRKEMLFRRAEREYNQFKENYLKEIEIIEEDK